MAIRTRQGIEVEIVKVIQYLQNGDARVGIRQVGRSHYEVVAASNLQTDGGQQELAAALARAEQPTC